MRTKQIDEQYLRDNFEKLSTEELANNLKIGTATVLRKAKKLGLKNKTRVISIDEDFLIKNFTLMTRKEIAKYLGVGEHIVYNKSKELGLIREQKYKYNVDFFKSWSHDMAYILGFIVGDGCIQHNKGCNSWKLNFGQKFTDKSVVEFIASKLGSNLVVREESQFDKRTKKTYYSARLEVFCKEMVDDLINLGICERKTGSEKLPEIPQEYKMSFLCGYHDADGHLENGNNDYKYYFEFTCSNKQFLLDLQMNVCDGAGEVIPDRGWFSYKINRKEPCQTLDSLMTQNVSFYLKRKHFA